jgi:parvulin-like peptidyl-prolyl isomerase
MRALGKISVFLLLFLFSLAGCGGMNLFATPTPVNTPTPTEAPMALRVNGEGITIVEYQHELELLQSAQKEAGQTADALAQKTRILDNFIGQLLLAQAATANGHSVTDADLLQRITSLASQLGGQEKLDQWKAKYGYDDTALNRTLRRAMTSAWMRDQVAAQAGTTADQVHARQIRVNAEAEARSVQAQLQAGTDFATLAAEYDPLTRGDLGWFPRGYLYQPAVEDAAFALQPGQVSAMIKTAIGYHFVLVIERDAQHPLSPEALLFVQHQALDKWLKQKRSEAKIDILV